MGIRHPNSTERVKTRQHISWTCRLTLCGKLGRLALHRRFLRRCPLQPLFSSPAKSCNYAEDDWLTQHVLTDNLQGPIEKRNNRTCSKDFPSFMISQ